MTRERRVALVVLLLVLAAAGALALAMSQRQPTPARPPAERPTLLLLTSLPLVFSEDFSLQGGSPALRALESRYRVVPISVSSSSDLAKGRLLLMAHPLAQTAEDLVALDVWVRDGGRVLLLADAMLEWPSKRPLGDPLRAPPMFADTGLLAHWGLRLDAPDKRGPAVRKLAGHDVLTASPGLLFGKCSISSDRLVARCALGKGKATVIADADVLDVETLDGATQHNLDAVVSELSALGR